MKVKHTIIAPVGGENDTIFLGIKEFPTERIILVAEPDFLREAENIKKDLERFKIPTRVERLKGPVWEELFRIVHEVTSGINEQNVIINVASGRGLMNCAATSAAFVNGIKAFGMNDDGEIMVLPVLKFNYYKLLSERKMKLLMLLGKDECCSSLEQLSQLAKMSLSLVSYHINGNLKSEGMKQLGLVETKDVGGRIHVELTTLGKLLLKGYV
ncbi:winged helix-turn-helix transcriptional regulator [Candidatus Woesearchaeota archaeon]|nr:winged helix-turn-helix transcriptional regulator [Candidatus Woesearchaeota archaeon]